MTFTGWDQCSELPSVLAGREEGRQARKDTCVPTVPKGSFPELTEEENQWANQLSQVNLENDHSNRADGGLLHAKQTF